MPKLAEMLLNLPGPTPYLVVFIILLASGFGIPIPEDITLIAAGVLAYYEAANVWILIVVAFLGVMLGDGTMFWLGTRYGLALAQKPWIQRVISPERLATVSEILQKRGRKVLFAARFMPGLRSPIFFTAGALGVPARVFLFYDGLAALLSVPTINYTVYYFGRQMEEVIATIQRTNQGILAGIVILGIAFLIHMKIKRRSQRKDNLMAKKKIFGLF